MLNPGCGPTQRSEISRFEFPCSLEVERSKSLTEERGRVASRSREPDRGRDSSGGAENCQCEGRMLAQPDSPKNRSRFGRHIFFDCVEVLPRRSNGALGKQPGGLVERGDWDGTLLG